MTAGLRRGLVVAALALALDQLGKWWALSLPLAAGGSEVLPFLRIVRVWNYGINFGLFGDSVRLSLVLAAFALCVGAGLLLWTRRSPSRWHNTASGLVAGGAFGNAIDRLVHGAVHDFLNVSCCGIRNPYAFNLADTAIFLGVVLLVLRR